MNRCVHTLIHLQLFDAVLSQSSIQELMNSPALKKLSDHFYVIMDMNTADKNTGMVCLRTKHRASLRMLSFSFWSAVSLLFISALASAADSNSAGAYDGVYKPSNSNLRIASYNIMQDRIHEGKSRVDSWARILNGVKADIWMLQELFYGEPDPVAADGDVFRDTVESVTGHDDWN